MTELTGIIDPYWRVDDLDPRTWRAIGSFIDPGRYLMAGSRDEHGLFVLHDAGKILRIVDSVSGPVPLDGVSRVDDPQRLSQELFARGSWDRVHVIDRRHLQRVASSAQETPQRELTLDAYYRRVHQLVWGYPAGYAVCPPRAGHWNHWTYAGVASFLAGLSSPSALALGVIDDGQVQIGLVLRVDGGMIRRVTTFEGLAIASTTPALDAEYAGAVWRGLAEVAPPAGLLFCRPAVFTTWIEGADKRAVLRDAEATGNAIVRISETSGIAWL